MNQYLKNPIYFTVFFILFNFFLVNNGFADEKKVSSYMTETLELICKQNPGTYIYPDSIAISSDYSKIAYVSKDLEQNKMSVCIEGKCGEVWDQIGAGTPIFAPKTNRSAYIGHKGQYVYLVLDGKKGKAFDTINDVIFSKNGKHIAFWGEKFSKVNVVLDNTKSIQIDAISDMKFSNDSKKLVFTGAIDDKWYTFINGKKSDPYEWTTNIQISPDSKHIAYFAKIKGKMYTVLDGKILQTGGERLGILQFSEDSSQLAYSFCKASIVDKKIKEHWYMSINGEIGPELGVHSIFAFSPDAKQYAYVVGEKFGEQSIYKDGKKSDKQYFYIKDMLFSFDGKHFVYTVFGKKDGRNNAFVVYDGKKHESYRNLSVPLFSSNSSLMLYKGVVEKDNRKMIVNGNPEKSYINIGIPFYSPDGTRYGYAGLKDDTWQMIIDGKEENKYAKVGSADFDESSKHYAYTAMGKQKKWFIVADGHEGQILFDRNLPKAFVLSTGPNHFKTAVFKMNGENPELYWLKIKINE